MRSLVLTVAAVAIVTGGAALSSRLQAAPVAALRAAAEDIAAVEKAQFIFEGHRHCWYPDGWHGPGWYWCGYRARVGLGWGGAEGWQGWRHEEHEHHERRERHDRY
jgi:hypothetical protein